MNFRRGENRRLPDRASRIAELKRVAVAVLRATGWLAGTTVAAAAAVWLGWRIERWLVTSPFFAVDEIQIAFTPASGDHLPAQQVRALSGLSKGENVFRARILEARERLEQNPWIRSVAVARELPRRIRIVVEERRPTAYVELSGLYLIDEGGQVFKRATWEDQLDLPTITGLSRRDFIAGKPEVRAQIAQALDLIVPRPGTTNPWDSGELSEVHFDPDLGVTLDLGAEPTEVNLGFPPFAEKLERLRRARGELARRQLRATALYLDDSRQPDHVGMALAGPLQ